MKYNEHQMSRYAKSQSFLKRAESSIPLGAQTFSKSKTQFPQGVSPHFASHAKGANLWDIDGNRYVDFINALAAVTLGYGDVDVDQAVMKQISSGVTFSLSHTLEAEVAEALCRLIPCAERVRFGKNGSDATTAAVRVARAFTGRDHVAVCGYHGWQDWYIGSTGRNLGVPSTTKELTHSFEFNSIDTLKEILNSRGRDIAAVVIEPMNIVYPKEGFLEDVARLTRQAEALLIFDETITGFRFALGGAQEFFDVTPDLATFGKGLANGYPLSAIVGRADIMRLMEEVFFSSTFGGETLSLAAAKATLAKLEREDVLPRIAKKGESLIVGVESLIERHDMADLISISGHPSWSFLTFKETPSVDSWSIKSLFLQEIFESGFLTFGTHNISFAHTDEQVAGLLDAYNRIFPLLRKAIKGGDLTSYLRCEPIQPLFRVR